MHGQVGIAPQAGHSGIPVLGAQVHDLSLIHIWVLEALDPPLPVPVVWNSGGYERVETLRTLEGKVQIYLCLLYTSRAGSRSAPCCCSFRGERSRCEICPRRCKAERTAEKAGGVGRMPAGLVVARAMLHMWEEPVLSGKNGAGGIFF